MRRRTTFLAGLAVGLVAGAKLGRERYEQVKGYVQKFMANPTVRQTARTAGQKAGELTKMASQQAADKLPKVAEQARIGAAKVRHRNHDAPETDTATINGARPYS